jgi:hypothetical protein
MAPTAKARMVVNSMMIDVEWFWGRVERALKGG